MNERFRFGDGSEMNPFWVWRSMDETERNICNRLAKAGPLGWNRRSLSAAHIKFEDVEALIGEGVVKKASLLQLANEVVGNSEFVEEMDRLESEGGFLAVDKKGKDFIRSFELAQQIVADDPEESQEERFQLSNSDLYQFFQLY